MTIDVQIKSGHGRPYRQKIYSDGFSPVATADYPAYGSETYLLPFSGYFKDKNNLTEMAVDASTSPVDYIVTADEESEVFVKSISIYLADSGLQLKKFGAIDPLTNGIQMIWKSDEKGEVEIGNTIYNNFDFVRLSLGNPAFGQEDKAFFVKDGLGGSEVLIPVIDLQLVFGMPWGQRLHKQTKDRLIFRIRDDLTDIDKFNIIYFGTKLIE